MRPRVRAGFEPPAYIASLIASINDGAKAAQTGGLFVLAIAVYLTATVIATSDEVLLRGTSVEFSQLGVKIPVLASYALAPLLFLFLHVHTLIRYDMLAENLRLLDQEMRSSLAREPDRERCRQLLANVEFIQYWSSSHGSTLHSRLYKIVVWVMLVVVPVLVFLATQISFLRYQNPFVTYVVHFGCLALDLSALVYFWYRQDRRKQDWRSAGRWRAMIRNGLPAALLFAFAAVYLGIPPPDSTTTGPEAEGKPHGWRYHPLDNTICPFMGQLGWGCRHLKLDHRLLVAERPDGEVLYELRTGSADLAKLLIRVEALFLRGRNFRFADFEESEFFDADFSGADLRGASLRRASLQGAHLLAANMQGANLQGAQMQGANLQGAQMQGADLTVARMQGADLTGAELQNARLGSANMQGAILLEAQMQGAALGSTQMQATDLRGANFEGAIFDEVTNVSLADMRNIDITDPLPRVEIEPGRPALVEAISANFACVGEMLTTDEATYDIALAAYLTDLARADTGAASRIAWRAVSTRSIAENPDANRPLWPELARRLLTAEKKGDLTLDLSIDARKQLEALAAKTPVPPAAATVP
ncbi:MAG: pentapeptide repeat-containing protein [Rhodospirillales bacterium]|nr:pentapeptide repeat-containing protein [Rhodospirillales bacterium]